ncbi:MAG: T9SS type A sorting domain-containing protein [Bacteroidia bacterium]
MKNRPLFVLIALLFSGLLHAQTYGNIWHFGNNAGINFSNCVPYAIAEGANSGFEGCSSVCDANGGLLFYTNGAQVWDRLHNLMPNGPINSSNGSLSQTLIIQKPLSPNVYYIIAGGLQAQSSGTLKYYEVDMLLNNGLGDVVGAGTTMTNLVMTEQIAATYHSNGTDIWLMTHEYMTNNFMAFLLTAAGISSTPVVSAVGRPHTLCNSNINSRGEICFSPDGTKIAFSANGVGGAGNDTTNILEVGQFDANMGMVSNMIDLPYSRGDFGLSFSADNSKLYGATWKALNFFSSDYNFLYQFDLSSGNPATIINSKFIVDSMQIPGSYGDLKLGPDGKIYVAVYNSSYLGVINAPHLAGNACSYVSNGLYLGGNAVQFGLNNYIEYTNYCGPLDISAAEQKPSGLEIMPNPFSSSTTLHSIVLLDNATLTLFNALGESVRVVNGLSGNTIVLERNDLADGVYFAVLTQDEKIIAREKLIISGN